ncbi:MAG: NADH-quinone oxidoreductase subunit L [Chloroflexota bacterium]|nr:NADH-quinone oxidoreductase subunit L [Chloroflexota bacterium]
MELVWLTLLFPLLGFAVNALFGGWLPRRAPGIVATLAMAAAFAVAWLVLADLASLPHGEQHRDVHLYNWVVTEGFIAPLGAWIDPLSTLMLLIVTGVGFLIHLYATGYMADDEGQRRFFAYMNLFVLAMLVLVLADNFMLLLVGWGGVGFASFALISHYFYREDAADAAVKAFVINTIGDIGLMLGAFLIFRQFGTLQYFDTVAGGFSSPGVFGRVVGADEGTLTAITLLLLVGAIAKSGQVPLHTWLPDAMAGPTPVSALIHAATMVTAGVYLLARAWPLYEAAPATLTVITWIGAFTLLFAATIGLVQTNIKRVLAFSTVSQLGYMFLAAGVGAYGAAIFHLMTHAFFKALLFLAAGVVIHALGGEEDLPRMGGLRRALPLAWAAFGIGGLAIAGIPPFSGFFSKDEIIFSAFYSERGNALLGLIALVTGGLTAFYVFRAFFLAFHGAPRYAVGGGGHGHAGGHDNAAQPGGRSAEEDATGTHAHLHAPSFEMRLPLVILGLLAIVGGWVLIPDVTDRFETFLEPTFGFPTAYASPVEHAGGAGYWTLAIIAALLGAAGIGLAYLLYVARPALATQLARQFAGLHSLLFHRYYVDELYDRAVVRPVRYAARALSDGFDRALDGLVNGIAGLFREASEALRDLQTGYVRNYALMILGGTVLIVAYVLYAAG